MMDGTLDNTRLRLMQALLQELQALEVELHHPGVRCSRARLEHLLHAEFYDVGRSGRPYSRETVIAYLETLTAHPSVEPTQFGVSMLAPDCALLTYHSVQRCADGTEALPTWRTSLWLRGEAGWQLRFHQGTPAASD